MKAVVLLILASLSCVAGAVPSPSEVRCAAVLTNRADLGRATQLVERLFDDSHDAIEHANPTNEAYLWSRMHGSGRRPWVFVQSHLLAALTVQQIDAVRRYYRDLLYAHSAGRRRVLGPTWLSRSDAVALLNALTREAAGRAMDAGAYRDERAIPRRLGGVGAALFGGLTGAATLVAAFLGDAASLQSIWVTAPAGAATAFGAAVALGATNQLNEVLNRVQQNQTERARRREALGLYGTHERGAPILDEDAAVKLRETVFLAAAGLASPSAEPRWVHLAFGDRAGGWFQRSSWFDLILVERGDGFEAVALVR